MQARQQFLDSSHCSINFMPTSPKGRKFCSHLYTHVKRLLISCHVLIMMSSLSEGDRTKRNSTRENLNKKNKEITISNSQTSTRLYLLAALFLSAICLTAVAVLYIRLYKLELEHQIAVQDCERKRNEVFQVRLPSYQ